MYLARISKQPLQTGDINLTQGDRILIGENLTQHNQKIFIEAIKLKRSNILAKVITVDGLVHVKTKLMDKAIVIKTQRDLDILSAQTNNENHSNPGIAMSDSNGSIGIANVTKINDPSKQHQQQRQNISALHKPNTPSQITNEMTSNNNQQMEVVEENSK